MGVPEEEKATKKNVQKMPENILNIMKNILYNPATEPIPSRINTRRSIHRLYVVIVKC